MRRFDTRRSIVFHRTPDGYDTVVALEGFDQQAGGDVGRMFDAATGSLLHRSLRYRLGDAGKIRAVEDAVRNIDAGSGLIRDSRDVTEATLLDGTATHRSRIETVMTLALIAN